MLITVPMGVPRMLEKELTCYPQLPGVLRQCMLAGQRKACGKHATHKSQCMYVTQPACVPECNTRSRDGTEGSRAPQSASVLQASYAGQAGRATACELNWSRHTPCSQQLYRMDVPGLSLQLLMCGPATILS